MAAEELVALAEAALGVVPEADARELLLTRLVMDRPQRSAVEFVQSYMAADDPAAAMLVRVCRGAVGVSMHGDRLQPESHRLQSLWVCTCHPAAVRCWCVCKAGLWGVFNGDRFRLQSERSWRPWVSCLLTGTVPMSTGQLPRTGLLSGRRALLWSSADPYA